MIKFPDHDVWNRNIHINHIISYHCTTIQYIALPHITISYCITCNFPMYRRAMYFFKYIWYIYIYMCVCVLYTPTLTLEWSLGWVALSLVFCCPVEAVCRSRMDKPWKSMDANGDELLSMFFFGQGAEISLLKATSTLNERLRTEEKWFIAQDWSGRLDKCHGFSICIS